jgi:hypothetical protein
MAILLWWLFWWPFVFQWLSGFHWAIRSEALLVWLGERCMYRAAWEIVRRPPSSWISFMVAPDIAAQLRQV